MSIASSSLLILSLGLSIALGAQTDPWTWGPALLVLSAALVCALPALWQRPGGKPLLLAWGALCAAWYAWRAFQSPVAELAMADLLLLAGCGSALMVVLAVQEDERASRILHWGIAGLLLASLLVVGMQIADPTYRPIYQNHNGLRMVSGFFTHYNEGANFLIICSLWLLARAWCADEGRITRATFTLLGVAGLTAIWFTHSRGGILAAVVGAGVLAGLILIHAKRTKSKWFPIAVVGLALLVTLLAIGLLFGWQEAEQARGSDININQVFNQVIDNTIRLKFLGVATSCIQHHPFMGGGSQSYNWESLLFWDIRDQGHWLARPDFVHNEWVQAATDYGLIGFILLLVFIAGIAIAAILDLLFERHSHRGIADMNGLRAAGIAGLVGLSVHCCFSFLIHHLPGALCLGLCLAACMPKGPKSSNPSFLWLPRGLFVAAGILALIVVVPHAYKGARVYQQLWASRYAKSGDPGKAAQIAALDRALSIWPSAALHLQRGLLHHQAALQTAELNHESAEAAVADYSAAAKLHPHLPEAPLNRAQILSRLQRKEEAEASYKQAIELQGNYEGAFRGHYHFANHLFSIGVRQLAAGQHAEALDTLRMAASHVGQTPMWDAAEFVLDMLITESLGIAHALNGHSKEALECYERAASMHGGSARRIHFRSALLLADEANRIWYERRPEEALGLFLQARKCANDAGGQLPFGVSQEQADAFLKQLDETIALLRAAQINPKAP